jgi:hypothetical protein
MPPRATAPRSIPKARKTKAGTKGKQKTAELKSPPDWEAIEPLYRANQKSVREIAKQFGCSDTAIHKHAKEQGWVRSLAERVKKSVRERLVREDGLQNGLQTSRATDDQVVDAASLAGFNVVVSHRKDIAQLNRIKALLLNRLEKVLSNDKPDGPCLGERESPGDLLEKMARITSRLIPMERIAYNLNDAAPSENPLEAILGLVDGARWSPGAA